MDGRILCSDPSMLSLLYERVFSFAISKTKYIVQDEATAQDIIQDVFQKLWSDKLEFADIKMAYQWIYVACHNRAIDHVRKNTRRARIASDVELSELKPPSLPEERIKNSLALSMVFKRLTERQSEILAFLLIDGATHQEISKLLEISTKTVQREIAEIQERITPLRGVLYES